MTWVGTTGRGAGGNGAATSGSGLASGSSTVGGQLATGGRGDGGGEGGGKVEVVTEVEPPLLAQIQLQAPARQVDGWQPVAEVVAKAEAVTEAEVVAEAEAVMEAEVVAEVERRRWWRLHKAQKPLSRSTFEGIHIPQALRWVQSHAQVSKRALLRQH
jgi:hypothetical protein